MKNINVQTLNVDEKKFFKTWILILQPFLKLRKQEVAVLSSLLYYRHKLSSQIKNKSIINELLFNTKTRKKIREELDIPDYSFNNILTTLRKKNLLVNNSINSKIIPRLEENSNNFKLVYNINITNEVN